MKLVFYILCGCLKYCGNGTSRLKINIIVTSLGTSLIKLILNHKTPISLVVTENKVMLM